MQRLCGCDCGLEISPLICRCRRRESVINERQIKHRIIFFLRRRRRCCICERTSMQFAPAGPAVEALRLRATERNDRSPTHFVYLMYDNNDADVQTTSIEIACNPARDVLRFNRGLKKHRKSGKANSRDWRLQQWIGPFNRFEAAQHFQAHWARGGSDLATRILRGAQLASTLNLAIYSMDEIKLRSLLVK